VEDPLADGLVDGGNSNLRGFGSGVLIAGGGSALELLDVGLEQRLGSLVLFVLCLGHENSLLGRLDIGHENTSSAYRTHGTCKYRYFTTMQKKIIQNSPGKIKRKFIFFQKNLNFAGIGPRRAGKTDSHALQIQKYHPLCFELRD